MINVLTKQRMSEAKAACLNCKETYGYSKMFWKRKFCSDKCRARFFYRKLKEGYGG